MKTEKKPVGHGGANNLLKLNGWNRDKQLGEYTEGDTLTSLAMQLSSDVSALEEIGELPDFSRVSSRNQVVFMAYVSGYPMSFIGEAFGVCPQMICKIIDRLDPDRRFRLDEKAKKALITRIYESRCIAALSSITPEKLKESSAKELAAIAKTMSDAAANMNRSKHKGISSSRVDNMMRQLEAEASGAPYDE